MENDDLLIKKAVNCLHAILQRCYNPKSARYSHYGGRGISVCDRWRNPAGGRRFHNGRGSSLGVAYFICDMGIPPSTTHSIERKDVNGDYCPANCIWATPKIQQRNTTRNHNITAFGRTQTLIEWIEELDLDYQRVWARLKLGFSPEEALTKIKRPRARKVRYQNKIYSVKEASELFGIPYRTVRNRLSRGWSMKDALTRGIQTKYIQKRSD